jgi:hypothetical protein
MYNLVELNQSKKKAFKGAMFKLPGGFFEMNRGPLERFVEWPDLKTYTEPGASGRLFRLSLVGIDVSCNTTGGTAQVAKRRETSRSLVKALYSKTFPEADAKDKSSMEMCVNTFQTFAVFVSRGSTPRTTRPSRKLPVRLEDTSIFDLVDTTASKGGSSMECIAAITLSPCKAFQFVHWMAVSGEKSPDSNFRSWRNRGLGAYLFHVVVKRAMLPGVTVPTAIMLQCVDESDLVSTVSPLRFYLRLGFVAHRHMDNGVSKLTSDSTFVKLCQAYPAVWVTSKESEGMCLMELATAKLVNYAVKVIDLVDDDVEDKGNEVQQPSASVFAKFPLVAGLHEIESLIDGMHVMRLIGDPLYDTNASIDDKRCTYVVRDTGNAAFLSGSVSAEWRSHYDTTEDRNSPSMWLTSSFLSLLLAWTLGNRDTYRDTVLIVPPDVTQMIENAWRAFTEFADAPINTPVQYANQHLAWQKNEVPLNNYLKREGDLFQKKLIYFVHNCSNLH